MNQRRSSIFMIEQKMAEVAKLEEGIKKADARLVAITAGDWSVLPELKTDTKGE